MHPAAPWPYLAPLFARCPENGWPFCPRHAASDSADVCKSPWLSVWSLTSLTFSFLFCEKRKKQYLFPRTVLKVKHTYSSHGGNTIEFTLMDAFAAQVKMNHLGETLVSMKRTRTFESQIWLYILTLLLYAPVTLSKSSSLWTWEMVWVSILGTQYMLNKLLLCLPCPLPPILLTSTRAYMLVSSVIWLLFAPHILNPSPSKSPPNRYEMFPWIPQIPHMLHGMWILGYCGRSTACTFWR